MGPEIGPLPVLDKREDREDLTTLLSNRHCGIVDDSSISSRAEFAWKIMRLRNGGRNHSSAFGDCFWRIQKKNQKKNSKLAAKVTTGRDSLRHVIYVVCVPQNATTVSTKHNIT